VKADGQCVLQNDVALLHLSKATANIPLWIAPSPAAVTNGTTDVLYGYGQTNVKKPATVGSLHRTKSGDWTIDTKCNLATLIGATCMAVAVPGGSAGSNGDNGGPWTMAVDTNLVETLVFSGYDKAKSVEYGTGVTQTSTGAWLSWRRGPSSPTRSAAIPGSSTRRDTGGRSRTERSSSA
jgi:hypothetical protein